MGMTVADAPVVANLYPWKEVKRVCDVGGGRGTLLSELLIRHPHLQGVLCDGPGIIVSRAQQLLGRRGRSKRVEPGGGRSAAPPAGTGHRRPYLLKNAPCGLGRHPRQRPDPRRVPSKGDGARRQALVVVEQLTGTAME